MSPRLGGLRYPKWRGFCIPPPPPSVFGACHCVPVVLDDGFGSRKTWAEGCDEIKRRCGGGGGCGAGYTVSRKNLAQSTLR
jgi:hypothetical protein